MELQYGEKADLGKMIDNIGPVRADDAALGAGALGHGTNYALQKGTAMGSPFLKMAGKAAGAVGRVGMAAATPLFAGYEVYDAMDNSGKHFNLPKGQKPTHSQEAASAIGGIANAATLGLMDGTAGEVARYVEPYTRQIDYDMARAKEAWQAFSNKF